MTITSRPYRSFPVSTIQKSVDEIINEFHLLDKSPAAMKDGGPAAAIRSGTPAPSDNELIEKIRKSHDGPKFSALYDRGDMNAYDNDQSRADQALLSILSFWTGSNAEQMKRIFLSSRLAESLDRKVHHKDDYLNRSIKRAIETTTGHYSPKTYAAMKRAEETKKIIFKAAPIMPGPPVRRKRRRKSPFHSVTVSYISKGMILKMLTGWPPCAPENFCTVPI